MPSAVSSQARKTLSRWLHITLQSGEWSAKALAAKAGLDESTLSRALRGQTSLGWDRVWAVAEAAGADTPRRLPQESPSDRVPFLGTIEDLPGAFVEGRVQSGFPDVAVPDARPGIAAVKCRNSSMEPWFIAGDLVVIDYATPFEPGERCLVQTSSDAKVFLYLGQLQTWLTPEAPSLRREPSLQAIQREDTVFCARIVAIYRELPKDRA